MTNPVYITKPTAADPYRVDGRATIINPKKPEIYNIHGGPRVDIVSGVRVNVDIWPSPSGT